MLILWAALKQTNFFKQLMLQIASLALDYSWDVFHLACIFRLSFLNLHGRYNLDEFWTFAANASHILHHSCHLFIYLCVCFFVLCIPVIYSNSYFVWTQQRLCFYINRHRVKLNTEVNSDSSLHGRDGIRGGTKKNKTQGQKF